MCDIVVHRAILSYRGVCSFSTEPAAELGVIVCCAGVETERFTEVAPKRYKLGQWPGEDGCSEGIT